MPMARGELARQKNETGQIDEIDDDEPP
jgi:hypothetical protein